MQPVVCFRHEQQHIEIVTHARWPQILINVSVMIGISISNIIETLEIRIDGIATHYTRKVKAQDNMCYVNTKTTAKLKI